MQAWLEYVVRALADRPDAVIVTHVEREGQSLYELRLHPTDVGRIIGREGATIQALRALLQVGAARQGKRCSLELVEEEPPAA